MKALALFSGGLDSLLAIKIIKDMGIEVLALHFNIGFISKKDKTQRLEEILSQINVPLKVLDIRKQFFNEVLFKPQYGYGKYFNPCIDCHANMFSHALEMLESEGASFVISGEVLGQRPKSQRAEALGQVEKLCEGNGLIVRPLSAKLLPPTIPETKGWIDREKLLGIHGRSRETQLKLIKNYGIKEYANPGGGCLLTDTSIAHKLKDLQSHREVVFEDMEMVKFGRYFVLPGGARCVISRNEEENANLDFIHPNMNKIELVNCVGPLGLIEKESNQEDKELAIALTLLYGKTQKEQRYQVRFEGAILERMPYSSKEEAKQYLLQNHSV